MYEQEKQRLSHLTILICYTVLTIVLTAEAALLGWDMGGAVLLLLGIVLIWGVHITEIIPDAIRLWLYFLLSMLAFFYYGTHESSMFDIAMVMITFMVIYSVTEMNSIINCCMLTYYLTMGYDLIVVSNGSIEWNPLTITRTILHFVMVLLAGQMIKIVLQRHSRERALTEQKIIELEEVHKRTEEFLTNVSHELRTPINAVTGISAVMIKNEEDSEKRKDIISIQNAGRRLFQQIEDILDYTEIDTGRIAVSEDIYMISSIVNDIITEARLRERESAPELVFDVDAGMPAALIGDGRKIKKIIRHLVDNAIKYTKTGGVYVRICAIPKSYGINLCIRVNDTGIGIAEEHLQKITERFYQANEGKNRRAGGLGLGLPIVYGMVAALEGFIQIESKAGEGTLVSVSLPQKIADEAPCMSVRNRSALCMACFLRPEKYSSPEVRDYYNAAILHMVQELELTLHRISSMEDLNKLISMYQLTHLFIGKEEYQENMAYLENLDKNTEVIVFADNGFVLPKNSRVTLVKKPFYCLSLVNILNATVSKEEELFGEKRIRCPGIRVLVVDDEPMNLMVAKGIFEGYQMQVTTADSGKKAIELCRTEEFDLIFLDHMMPEMDGVETLKLLRKLPTESGQPLTVIAFTANAVSGAREMFRREGFDEFVSKPVEDVELERVLKKVLPKSAMVLVDDNDREISVHAAAEEEASSDEMSVQQSNELRLARLESASIHTKSALNYCSGDVSFYMELLTRFVQEAPQKETEINSFYAKKDMDNYRIRVHSLKSTSKMIGAADFSELAKNAEDAAKNQDMEYIREHHGELVGEYQVLVRHIRNILGLEENAAVRENTEVKSISEEELLLHLRDLKSSLDTFETDRAASVFEELSEKTYNGRLLTDLLSDVRQDADNFECDTAAGKLAEIIRDVEGGKV